MDGSCGDGVNVVGVRSIQAIARIAGSAMNPAISRGNALGSETVTGGGAGVTEDVEMLEEVVEAGEGTMLWKARREKRKGMARGRKV